MNKAQLPKHVTSAGKLDVATTKLKKYHRKLKERFAMELCMQINAHTSITGFSRIP